MSSQNLCMSSGLLVVIWVISVMHPADGTEEFSGGISLYAAIVNITFRDPSSGQWRSNKEEIGTYGSDSRLDSEWGVVVHVRTADNKSHGCTPPVNVPTHDRWIALIERGTCKFHQKVYNAAIVKNASAVVVYNHEEFEVYPKKHRVDDVVSIFITKESGERIASLVDNGTRVVMSISVGPLRYSPFNSINRTSVLFVSTSFIVLMVISLAWLVFYYIQRFRYSHSKDRVLKRLMKSAVKALNKMPQKTLHKGDKELDPEFDLCAVCVENYRLSEVVRVLPCSHVFHKSCVDPWLVEKRTCPMCKLDILQAYGIQCATSIDLTTSNEMESHYLYFEAAELLFDNDIDPLEMVERIHYHRSDRDAVNSVDILRIGS